MDTLEQLNRNFNNKFIYLKLLSVVYAEETLICTITFLYPYQVEEISEEDRALIYNFYKELLALNGELKIKYKKSFLDERLINEAVAEYFETNKKAIFPYIFKENISSTHIEQDVFVSLNLNQDVLSLLDENELALSLKNYLEKQFIANVQVQISENEDTLPKTIDIADLPISTTVKTRRYDVKIEKKVIGGDIVPKPEYIADIKAVKSAVILGGVISNKSQKTFTIKKGKNAGKEKSLYTFVLKDKEGGVIDCVYFCPKTHEKDMEALDDQFMIVCVGDVKVGISGKLTYYIQKLSIATPVELIIETSTVADEEEYVHKQVVFPEIIQRETQTNLFEVKAKYNDYIMKNKFIVFDFETTGLDTETCEITEIGAVKVENGEIIERFASFAKTENPIPDVVIEKTHITNEMLKGAPRVEDVIYDFYEWSRGYILSGYNIVNFDLKILRRVAKKIGLVFDNDIIDAIIVARQSPLLRTSKYNLGAVVKALGLTLVDAHRAYNDAQATAMVLMELNRAK